MRIFQNSGISPGYFPRLRRITRNCTTFDSLVGAFLRDGFGACHFLKPVLDRESSAFFTNGDDEFLQRQWAREQGMRSNATLAEILLAQIENHRTEVFYNLDPMRYQSNFVRKLPGCVKKSIAWRAAPSPRADFTAYDAIVCNFTSIINSYRANGQRSEYFSPAYDPKMEVYSVNTDRPIDILFVGSYSRHHRQRALILEAVSKLQKQYNIVFCLDSSKFTKIADSRLGPLLLLNSYRRPLAIRAVCHSPVFGMDLYSIISKAKVVLNGAIDMAGNDRGNMRCFEAMGCGAALLTDEGNYPEGMLDGVNLLSYSLKHDVNAKLLYLLNNLDLRQKISQNGLELMRNCYNKLQQWEHFQSLINNAI
jgi:glycosyltransferase involved in cell wall biosynthesis